MPNGKGFRNQPDSKTQPPECGGYSASYNGDGKDFNIKGKITNNKGSDYHDQGRSTSGLYGNFAEKDAQRQYLIDRNKKGQEVNAYSGTHRNNRIHTSNVGTTAFNDRPIDETYIPATSHDIPTNHGIVRPMLQKTDSTVPYPSNTNLTKKVKK